MSLNQFGQNMVAQNMFDDSDDSESVQNMDEKKEDANDNDKSLAAESEEAETKVDIERADATSAPSKMAMETKNQRDEEETEKIEIKIIDLPQPNLSEIDSQIKAKELESIILDHRQKFLQISALFNDETDLKSKKELEILKNQLKDNMIDKQNELKIIINDRVKLTKQQHGGHVCEAFYDADKTWYAALIQDIDESNQAAEIAWIGLNKQAKRVNRRYITVLQAIESQDLFIGAKCTSVCPENGMWFPCTIEKIIVATQEDEEKMLETGDFRLLQNRYQVKFQDENFLKATVPLDFLRLSRDNRIQNKSIFESIRKKKLKSASEIQELTIPDHMKVKSTDNEKVKSQKQKKIKAIKLNHKIQVQKTAATQKQNSWLNFNSKAIKKQKGHFGSARNESIFKSPDTVGGKVGVTNLKNYGHQNVFKRK